MSTHEASLLIGELHGLLRSLDGSSEIETRRAYHEQAKSKIVRLRALSKGMPGEIYAREKITDVETHFAGLAGINDMSSHPRMQNTTWVLGALDTLQGLYSEATEH